MRKDYRPYPGLKRKLGGHKIKDDRNMYKQLFRDGLLHKTRNSVNRKYKI